MLSIVVEGVPKPMTALFVADKGPLFVDLAQTSSMLASATGQGLTTLGVNFLMS